MIIRLQSESFDSGQLLTQFCDGRPETGAVVSFTGLVRCDGGDVQALELEAYAGFTEAEIGRAVKAACERFGVQDVIIVHRTGRIEPGEPVVFVAAASAHRRAAFLAADHLMDYLKSRAPFWKQSHERGGSRWVEPTPADHEDASRWDPPNHIAAPHKELC